MICVSSLSTWPLSAILGTLFLILFPFLHAIIYMLEFCFLLENKSCRHQQKRKMYNKNFRYVWNQNFKFAKLYFCLLFCSLSMYLLHFAYMWKTQYAHLINLNLACHRSYPTKNMFVVFLFFSFPSLHSLIHFYSLYQFLDF